MSEKLDSPNPDDGSCDELPFKQNEGLTEYSLKQPNVTDDHCSIKTSGECELKKPTIDCQSQLNDKTGSHAEKNNTLPSRASEFLEETANTKSSTLREISTDEPSGKSGPVCQGSVEKSATNYKGSGQESAERSTSNSKPTTQVCSEKSTTIYRPTSPVRSTSNCEPDCQGSSDKLMTNRPTRTEKIRTNSGLADHSSIDKTTRRQGGQASSNTPATKSKQAGYSSRDQTETNRRPSSRSSSHKSDFSQMSIRQTSKENISTNRREVTKSKVDQKASHSIEDSVYKSSTDERTIGESNRNAVKSKPSSQVGRERICTDNRQASESKVDHHTSNSRRDSVATSHTKSRPSSQASREKISTGIGQASESTADHHISNTRQDNVATSHICRPSSQASREKICTSSRQASESKVHHHTSNSRQDSVAISHTKSRPSSQASREKICTGSRQASESKVDHYTSNRTENKKTDKRPSDETSKEQTSTHNRETVQARVNKKATNSRQGSVEISADKRQSSQTCTDNAAANDRLPYEQNRNNKSTNKSSKLSQISTDNETPDSRPGSQSNVHKPAISRPQSQASTVKKSSNSSLVCQTSTDRSAANNGHVRQSSIDKARITITEGNQSNQDLQITNGTEASQVVTQTSVDHCGKTIESAADKPDIYRKKHSQIITLKSDINRSPVRQVGVKKSVSKSSSGIQDSVEKSVGKSSSGIQDSVEKSVGKSSPGIQDSVEKSVSKSSPGIQDSVEKSVGKSSPGIQDSVEKSVGKSSPGVQDSVEKSVGKSSPGVQDSVEKSVGESSPGIPDSLEKSVGKSSPGIPDSVEKSVGKSSPGIPDSVEKSVGKSSPGIPDSVEKSVGNSSPGIQDSGEKSVGKSSPGISDSVEQSVSKSSPGIPDSVGKSVGKSSPGIQDTVEKLDYGQELVKQVTKKLLSSDTLVSDNSAEKQLLNPCVSQSEPHTPVLSRNKRSTKTKKGGSVDMSCYNSSTNTREDKLHTTGCKSSSLKDNQSSFENKTKHCSNKRISTESKMSFSKSDIDHRTDYSKFEREASMCSSRNSIYNTEGRELEVTSHILSSQNSGDYVKTSDSNKRDMQTSSRASSRNSNYEVRGNEDISKYKKETSIDSSRNSVEKIVQGEYHKSRTGSPRHDHTNNKTGRHQSINIEERVNTPNRRRSASQSSRKLTGDSDRHFSFNTMEDPRSSEIMRKSITSPLSNEFVGQSDSGKSNEERRVHQTLAEYNRSQMSSCQTSSASVKGSEHIATQPSQNKEEERTDYTKNIQTVQPRQNSETSNQDIEHNQNSDTPNTTVNNTNEKSKHLKQFIRQDSIRSENLSQRSTPLPYSSEASRVSSPTRDQHSPNQTKDIVANQEDNTNHKQPVLERKNKRNDHFNDKFNANQSETHDTGEPNNVAQITIKNSIDQDVSLQQSNSIRQSLFNSHGNNHHLLSEASKWSGPGHLSRSVQNLDQLSQEDRILACPIKPPRRSRSEAMISDLCEPTKPAVERLRNAAKPIVKLVKDDKNGDAILQRAMTEHGASEENPGNVIAARKCMSETQLNYNTLEMASDIDSKQRLRNERELPNLIPKYDNMSSKKPMFRAKSERYLSSAPKNSMSRSMHELRRMARSANDLQGRSMSILSGLSDRSETMSELSQLSESLSEQSVFNESSSRATVMRKRPAEDASERWIKDIIASQGDFHLQGLLTCFYCNNLMEEPQILPNCLHSFCKSCLAKQPTDTIEDTKGILCPKCGQFCTQTRMKSNIFFDELLDIYNMNKGGSHKECKQCPDKVEPFWMCLDCKIDLCEKCHTIHLMIPLLQGHTVMKLTNVDDMVVDRLVFCEQHLDEPIKFNCRECESVLCIKCKVTEHDAHSMETVENSLKRLMPQTYNITEKLEEKLQNLRDKIKEVDFKIDCTKQMFSKSMKDIDTTADDYVRRIRETQQQLKHDLRLKEEAEMNILSEFMTKLQFKQNEGNNLRDLVTISIMKGRQTSLLAEIQGGLFNNVRDYDIEIQKESSIQIAHPELKPNTRVDDIFEEGIIGKMNYHIINVLSSGSMPSYKKFMSVRFEEYFTQPLQKLLEINLPDQCVSISLVCDQIWAALPYTSSILVYDRFGELMRQIPVEDRQPRSIHQTNDGDVIMACQYTGLFLLNGKTGEVITKLTDGKFSDVCVRDERIFALEYNKKAVIVFKKVGMSTSDCCGVQWLQISSINISVAQQVDSVSTLLVNEEYDDNIYICSYNAHTIFHFNQHGELLGQYGRRGKEVAGELHYPMLCTSDKFGFILIADGENRRLQILDIWGMWREILLEGLRKPYNVTIDSKQSLWITQFHDQYQTWQLAKYGPVY